MICERRHRWFTHCCNNPPNLKCPRVTGVPDLITHPGSNRLGYSSESHWPQDLLKCYTCCREVHWRACWRFRVVATHILLQPWQRLLAWVLPSVSLVARASVAQPLWAPVFWTVKWEYDGDNHAIDQHPEDQPTTGSDTWLCPACRWHLLCLLAKGNPVGIFLTQKCKFTHNTLKLLFPFNNIKQNSL